MKIKMDKHPGYIQLTKKHITKSKSNLLKYIIAITIIVNTTIIVKLAIIKGKNRKTEFNINIRKISKNGIINNDTEYIQNITMNQLKQLDDFSYEFNQTVNEKYINYQNYFCDNFSYFYHQKFEDLICLTNVNFNGSYQMYIYKRKDWISTIIKAVNHWEDSDTKKLLNALNYYSNKTKIKNEDIYILDIGANIGWYSITLGRFGYKIIAFEPSEINNYILKKNYCLNRGINVTFINKGLSTEEKICDLYNIINNEGNGMVICNTSIYLPSFLDTNKRGKIILTKLNNYIPFLSNKNVALIKMDVEGFEGKAIEGGIKLITKYHIPFIFLEFTPDSLKLHGTDPKKFLQMFENNGYKISLSNFFDNNYILIDDIIEQTKGFKNLYIVYIKILE